jgi:hypothetical protein
VMATVSESLRPTLESATDPGETHRLLQVGILGLAMTLAAVAFFAAAWLFRIPEAHRLLDAVDRALRSLIRRGR